MSACLTLGLATNRALVPSAPIAAPTISASDLRGQPRPPSLRPHHRTKWNPLALRIRWRRRGRRIRSIGSRRRGGRTTFRHPRGRGMPPSSPCRWPPVASRRAADEVRQGGACQHLVQECLGRARRPAVSMSGLRANAAMTDQLPASRGVRGSRPATPPRSPGRGPPCALRDDAGSDIHRLHEREGGPERHERDGGARAVRTSFVARQPRTARSSP